MFTSIYTSGGTVQHGKKDVPFIGIAAKSIRVIIYCNANRVTNVTLGEPSFTLLMTRFLFLTV